jgi:hypothetical protein
VCLDWLLGKLVCVVDWALRIWLCYDNKFEKGLGSGVSESRVGPRGHVSFFFAGDVNSGSGEVCLSGGGGHLTNFVTHERS